MRIILASAAAFAFAACSAEAPAPAPEAEAAAPAAETHAMDENMKAADAADDADTAETPDGYMFHTDTTKIESVHLPAGTWTVTPADAAQVEIVSAADETMADGAVHHVVKVKPLVRDVIARVKFERADDAPETRTIMFMIH